MKKVELENEELEEKIDKKTKHKEGVAKRRKQKRSDKVVRWSGFILLLTVILIGFLLWVAGEMQL